MPPRVRNFTMLFKSTFSSFLVSLGILNEASEVILNEAGEAITAEVETVFGQGMSAGRMGGINTAIMPSTGGNEI